MKGKNVLYILFVGARLRGKTKRAADNSHIRVRLRRMTSCRSSDFKQKRPSTEMKGLDIVCGAYRSRTDDLLTASQTL